MAANVFNQSLVLSILWIFFSAMSAVDAIFADEIGISDFLVATTGHGPVSFVQMAQNHTMITSDGPSTGHQLVTGIEGKPTSCFVANRNLDTGALVWRRNVCTSLPIGDGESRKITHATAANTDGVWTMDSTGVVRAWTTDSGQLLWDALVPATSQPRVLVAPTTTVTAMGAVSDNEVLTLLDAATGEAMTGDVSLKADDVLKQQGVSSHGQGRWLQILSDETNIWNVLLGWEKNGIASDFVVVTLEWQDESLKITNGRKLDHVKALFASSLQVTATGQGLALSADATQAVAFGVSGGDSSTGDIANLMSWSKLTSVTVMNDSIARVGGTDAAGTIQQALFQLPSWDPLQDASNTVTAPGLVYTSCDALAGIVAAVQPNEPQVQLWTSSRGGTSLTKLNTGAIQGDVSLNVFDSIATMAATCDVDVLKVLVSTSLGTTAVFELPIGSSDLPIIWKWSTEEGLGQITSALVLDDSHAVVVDDLMADDSEGEPIEIAQRLQFSARLSSQWNSLVSSGMSLVSSSSGTKERLFGFFQVAVLLSEQTNRLYGMPLAGDSRGKVTWSMDLSPNALWHKMVHGSFNAHKATHGIHGGTHAREVLVVSDLSGRVEWKCVDGTNGDIHAQGAFEVSSPVLQVLPMVGGGACRQQATLLLRDLSTVVIPEPDAASPSSLQRALEESANGLFAHATGGGGSDSRLESYQITSQSSPARLVGQTVFPGERLVLTIYPTRDEAVDSPCTVLGDDSLLLKYLNPHLAVLVTVREEGIADELESVDSVLRRSMQQTDKKKKKKPLGVTPKTESKTDADMTRSEVVKEDEPNLFVNVVDTVSGRVLYRTSHTNASTSTRYIRAVISENWVVYSFVNAKTKRTEVGVLSLYEGMIHKKGISAFHSPEQTTEFSSWDARETKPVVLAKTYSIVKPVTAIGVTQTRNGISSHQVLLATNDDHIYALPRSALEPRRPLSDLKETEKLEGLRQYSEMLPLVSLQVLSYNLTVHRPTRIVSASTELESQTLVFAFGGPDIFFTRTSPSKGFDMLPENFNRVLLSVIVVGLVIVVGVTKRMATAKMAKSGWL